MGWVSPTGFVDPDTAWENETNAYDGNTGSCASNTIPVDSWGNYLELTIDAIDCDKVRFWAYERGTRINEISLDVYYEDDWHNIYEGGYTDQVWVEKTIPAGTKSVTAARVKFYNDYWNVYNADLYEFEFNQAIVIHEWEGSDGIAIGEALVKTPMKVLVDGFQFSDVTIKEFYKVLTDPIAFTDVLQKVYIYVRTFTDGIAIADRLVKSMSKVLSDGIAFTDLVCTIFVGKIIRTLTAVRNNVAVRIVSKIRDCWCK